MNTQLKDRSTTYRPLEDTDTPSPTARQAKAPAQTRTGRKVPRWVLGVAAVAVTAAAVVAVNVINADSGDTSPQPAVVTQAPAFDSPGGNSLNGPLPSAQAPTLPFPAGGGPGGNSLNAIPIAE